MLICVRMIVASFRGKISLHLDLITLVDTFTSTKKMAEMPFFYFYSDFLGRYLLYPMSLKASFAIFIAEAVRGHPTY